MNFYEIVKDGVPQLVRTKAEAKPYGVTEPTDIPLDQQSIMDRLNDLMRRAHQLPAREDPPEQKVEIEDNLPAREHDAGAILSRIDAPKGVDADAVVAAIFKARGHVLARFAKSIAMRFEEIAK